MAVSFLLQFFNRYDPGTTLLELFTPHVLIKV
jgi:hypothetical protein